MCLDDDNGWTGFLLGATCFDLEMGAGAMNVCADRLLGCKLENAAFGREDDIFWCEDEGLGHEDKGLGREDMAVIDGDGELVRGGGALVCAFLYALGRLDDGA